MKVPTCKLCGKAHWSSEPHAPKTVYRNVGPLKKYAADTEPSVPGYVRDMAKGALGRESSTAEERGRGGTAVKSPIPQTATSAVEPSRSDKTCNACNKPLHNRGKVCNACRQRAYRERK